MIGLGGNDVYFIVSGSEQLFEAAGGGSDVVYTNLGHALVSGQEIEILSAISNAATTAMDLTGNELANLIYANDGVNNLRGGGGADVLVGYGGNDVYYIVTGTESAIEAGGGGTDVVYTNLSYALGAGQELEILAAVSRSATTAMDLTGNAFANQLYANDGANVLDGGAGADFTLGYGGADSFAFTTALGAGNVDAIVDFLSGTDTIALDDAIFTGIAAPARSTPMPSSPAPTPPMPTTGSSTTAPPAPSVRRRRQRRSAPPSSSLPCRPGSRSPPATSW